MSKIEKLADEIVELTLLEAVELKDILKEKHGIEPAAGAVVAVAGPAEAGPIQAGEIDQCSGRVVNGIEQEEAAGLSH